MTAGLPLMKNVLSSLAKSVLLLFGLSAAMSATDVAIQKKIYEEGITILIISNKEVEDIMKIVKPLEKSRLLIRRISETIKNEAKKQKDGFLLMLLGTLAASILENPLTGKGAIIASEGVIRAGQKFQYHLIL